VPRAKVALLFSSCGPSNENRLVDDYMERGRQSLSPIASHAVLAKIVGKLRTFDALKSWWQRSNFAILSDEAHGSDRSFGAENRADGFRMSLRSNDVGGLYINVSSPCVCPKGTTDNGRSG
jgi:hypothetical protein